MFQESTKYIVPHRISLDAPYPSEALSLLGIASPLRGYKLAWLINQAITLQLVNVREIAQEEACIIHFLYSTAHGAFRLIQNKLEAGVEESIQYLVPKLPHFDFFFVVQDDSHTFDQNVFIQTMRTIEGVTYTAQLAETVWKDATKLVEIMSQ